MIRRFLASLPVDAEDLSIIGVGLVLLVALTIVVLALAGMAGLAVAVFEGARGL